MTMYPLRVWRPFAQIHFTGFATLPYGQTRITAQKEIGGDKTQMTFSSNVTFKGNIEVTNTGELVMNETAAAAR
jgi:hypothetical protein